MPKEQITQVTQGIAKLRENLTLLQEKPAEYGDYCVKIQKLTSWLEQADVSVLTDKKPDALIAFIRDMNNLLESLTELVQNPDQSTPILTKKQLLKDKYPLIQSELVGLIDQAIIFAQQLLTNPDEKEKNLAATIFKSIDIYDLLNDDSSSIDTLGKFSLLNQQLIDQGRGSQSTSASEPVDAIDVVLKIIASPQSKTDIEQQNRLITLNQAKLELINDHYSIGSAQSIIAAAKYLQELRRKSRLLTAEQTDEQVQLKNQIEMLKEDYAPRIQQLFDSYKQQLLQKLKTEISTPQECADLIKLIYSLFELTPYILCFIKKQVGAISADDTVSFLSEQLSPIQQIDPQILRKNMELLFSPDLLSNLDSLTQYAITTICAPYYVYLQPLDQQNIQPTTLATISKSTTSLPFWKNRWVRFVAALLVITAASIITGGIALGVLTLAGVGLAGTALMAANAGAIVATTATEIAVLKKIIPKPKDFRPRESTAKITQSTAELAASAAPSTPASTEHKPTDIEPKPQKPIEEQGDKPSPPQLT